MKKRVLVIRVKEYSNIEPSITIEAVLDNDEQAMSLAQKLDDVAIAKRDEDVHHEIYRN
tara:strand:- start:107 stop:283 length:177 start_codon:yes stop_codon:yes gene_type:complete